MVAQRKRPTAADVEALPEHFVGEIIAGELVASPRPAPRHSNSSSGLGMLLGPPFRFGTGGPGGWLILDEPELRLDIDPDFEVIVPDLAGWRRERMPQLPKEAWFSLAPDWVCEVLSPLTGARDRADKLPFYARAKVQHIWLVDPILCTLEAFKLDGNSWRLLGTHRGNAKVRVEPFDAIELELGLLWEL